MRRVHDGWGTGRVPGLLKVLINWELFRRACQKVEDKVLIIIFFAGATAYIPEFLKYAKGGRWKTGVFHGAWTDVIMGYVTK